MVKSILVTGGCGFIGTSLIRKFVERWPNLQIRVLDNLFTGKPDDLAEVTSFSIISPKELPGFDGGVALIEGDIRNSELVQICTQNVDSIIHLAANTGVRPSIENPRLDMECNVLGTFNMLEAARVNGVKKFIFASSGAPAGQVEPPIHEELPPHPVSPYGASKLAGEGYCSAYFRTFGIDTVCLRFGNVYGPRSKKKSSVVAKFIRQAVAGETCTIYGDGTQTRDFLYIDDLVRAVILAMEKEVGGETFQIATGMERTVGELAELIATALSKRDMVMRTKYDAPLIGDVKRNFSDTSKAKRMLGWEAKMEIKQGIEKTLDYFLENS
ncbi:MULTISPECIES: NAD-dependent epimerase/dehydratase family protein [unclassified Okeania]|uniref:NAD-dependent epimerase/dehydratase family protein n=1 Tax=unclassified Okeania TaxID=2634635 RepID=UPI0013B5CD45|nr:MULTISPECIES: NAD-dependent epimerase/dehydratase family protein [unclassified Okeania]NES77035.1 NAD-dependent epimerase/dehydratase family protein [Okeania sp. SIO1H4]NET18530.1 NAD-dependent epimerase/dehydratase family protein [Okeania sp. SIO1H5]NET94873.1 NAD-dependent epimerase/dehydratase family protein [Okeania sp. SIO1H2]